MTNKYATQAKEAREERLRKRMCTDKARFSSEAHAQQPGQRHYRCPFCQGWHRSGAFASLVAKVHRLAAR